MQYENGKPVGVREIVVSHQHLVEDLTSNQVRDIVEPYVREALPKDWINGKTIWHINRPASSTSAARMATPA